MFFQKSKTIQELKRQLQSVTTENETLKKQLHADELEHDTTIKAYDALYREKASLKTRFDHIFKENTKLTKNLKDVETENRRLTDELEDVNFELDDCRKHAEYLDAVCDSIRKSVIKKAESAIQAVPEPSETDPLEELKKRRDDAQKLWIRFGRNEVYLLKACEALIAPGKSLDKLLPEEDCNGTFERNMSEDEEIEWRENYEFGEIVDSRFVGMYEFCDYEIDRDCAEYIAYRIKLYKKAALLQVKNRPMEALCAAPEFFFGGRTYTPAEELIPITKATSLRRLTVKKEKNIFFQKSKGIKNLENEIANFTDFPVDSNWCSGFCGRYQFEAKLFDIGSCFGINGGRVSKLYMQPRKEGGSDCDIISYDRGWDIKPNDKNRNTYEAIMELLENAPKRFEEKEEEI